MIQFSRNNYLMRGLFFILILSTISCDKNKSMDDECYLSPERGPCKAMLPRYFYNSESGQCEEFIWGGCDGVVPFVTMEECQKGCSNS